jgi:hypothetical protein
MNLVRGVDHARAMSAYCVIETALPPKPDVNRYT